MAFHIIIGAVLFAAAIVGVAFLIGMLAAAAWPLTGKGIGGIPKRSIGASSGETPREEASLEPAECYWDCMNGFRWGTDWESRCASACGLPHTPGVA
jgi:hypothetical protein